MALRIHFTADDMARTRVSPVPDVMWELGTSLRVLQSRRPAVRHRSWLRQVRARLAVRDLRSTLRVLTTLVPPHGAFPDFLTPLDSDGIDTSLDLIRSTPADWLRRDLAFTFCQRTPPLWVRQLAEGGRAAREELQHALAVYHRELLAPYLPVIGEQFHAERARRSQDVLNGGFEQVVNTLMPSMRWTTPTLTHDFPWDGDIHLQGRGITLIPSFFCADFPSVFTDPELPPVLVYPIAHQPQPSTSREGLGTLIGRTRATILCALTPPCSTSQLALRAGVSISTASEHASALRDAGLITSTRQGSTMLHAQTLLGRDLSHGHTAGVRTTNGPVSYSVVTQRREGR